MSRNDSRLHSPSGADERRRRMYIALTLKEMSVGPCHWSSSSVSAPNYFLHIEPFHRHPRPSPPGYTAATRLRTPVKPTHRTQRGGWHASMRAA
jgi:hypothetical protein